MKNALVIASTLSAVLFACAQSASSANREDAGADNFWDKQPAKAAPADENADPSPSYVFAGLTGYFNFSDRPNDDNTVGLKILSSMKDYFEFVALRLDGMLCVEGPAEGLLEADFTLVRGLSAGLGAAYTRRLKLSPRFGLYVEDPSDTARRGGIFLLGSKGYGLEIGWPFAEKWSFAGEFGKERKNNTDYTRVLAGIYYRFF